MRTMQFGAATVRLPVLRLEVHTDGGFLADLGFPWNNDFSRSAQVEVAIFLGSGGFYYGITAASASDLLTFTGGYGYYAPDSIVLNSIRTLRLGFAARVGIGRLPSSVKINTSQVNAIDPASEDVRSLVRDFATVEDMHCTIAISKVKSLGISGVRQEVAAFARSLLCQIACEHSPEDVRILAILPVSQQHDWDWLNELPHTEPLRGCKLPRLTAMGEDEADKLLSFLLEELSQRASRQAELASSGANASSSQSVALPHLVVLVHDYMDVHKHPALSNAFKLGEQLGVSIIYLVAEEQAVSPRCFEVVLVGGRTLRVAPGFDAATLRQLLAVLEEVHVC